MPDPKRWVNAVETHGFFVTTTVRGWAPIFRRPSVTDAVMAGLISDCQFYGARLMSFAIMPHHVHFVCFRPVDREIGWFMDRFKSNSSKRLLPMLNSTEIRMLKAAPYDHGNLMWKRSFRGIPLTSEAVRARKTGYIHRNPVRAGLCDTMAEYKWSSHRWIEAGLFHVDNGLDLDLLAKEFGEPPPLTSLQGWRDMLEDF